MSRAATLGFNIWSPNARGENPALVVQQVEAMHAAGFRRVVLIPFVYADMTSGEVKQDWPGSRTRSISDAELTAAAKRAKTLGMNVNVTPFVEPRERAVGRDRIKFTPGTDAGRRFWDEYRAAVVHFAKLAREARVDEFNVGSELVGIDHERLNTGEWDRLINESADAFGVNVGYTTQHWTFDQDATVDMIWKHPKVVAVSISAYLSWQPEHGHAGLASPDDCRGSASDGEAFVATVTKNFDDFYAQRLGPVAKLVGKPVRLGEFGVAPYDTAATTPWKWDWPKTPYDPTEAANTWRGVLAAVDRHPEIQSVDAWIWDWPGGFDGEVFRLRPGAAYNDATMTVLTAYARRE